MLALVLAAAMAAVPAPALSPTQRELSRTFHKLVPVQADSEVRLDLSYLKATDATLAQVVLKDALAETDGVQLIDFQVKEYFPLDQDADDRLAEVANKIGEVAGTYDAFFCSRFAPQPKTAAECGYKVVDLLSALSHDPDARVFLVTIDGDAYGSFRAAILYVTTPSGDFDAPKKVTKIYFDAVHEI